MLRLAFRGNIGNRVGGAIGMENRANEGRCAWRRFSPLVLSLSLRRGQLATFLNGPLRAPKNASRLVLGQLVSNPFNLVGIINLMG